MYDTEKRVALVKKRMAEHHRRQVQRSIRRLSALCLLLFLALVGAAGMVQGQPMDVAGMYGAILLHEGAGGYVLVAVISFTAAIFICPAVGSNTSRSKSSGRNFKTSSTTGAISAVAAKVSAP